MIDNRMSIDVTGETACITDIQRFSVHDGPGIRTIVFFKGCPLRCIWCQNPETQCPTPEMMIDSSLCIGCLKCVEVCGEKAISIGDGELLYDRERCSVCGKCDLICGSGARKKVGKIEQLESITETVLKDKVFYRNTHGGLTVSGGEPTVHAEFVAKLLKAVKTEGINTAMETCGYCIEGRFIQAIEHCDLLLFDVKHTSFKIHKDYTGVGNELILQNLRTAAGMNKNIIIRIPLIPGVNSDEANLAATARIAAECHAKEIHLLPFHQLGQEKWNNLNMEYFCEDFELPGKEMIAAAADILSSSGVPVNVGGHGEYRWQ